MITQTMTYICPLIFSEKGKIIKMNIECVGDFTIRTTGDDLTKIAISQSNIWYRDGDNILELANFREPNSEFPPPIIYGRKNEEFMRPYFRSYTSQSIKEDEIEVFIKKYISNENKIEKICDNFLHLKNNFLRSAVKHNSNFLFDEKSSVYYKVVDCIGKGIFIDNQFINNSDLNHVFSSDMSNIGLNIVNLSNNNFIDIARQHFENIKEGKIDYNNILRKDLITEFSEQHIGFRSLCQFLSNRIRKYTFSNKSNVDVITLLINEVEAKVFFNLCSPYDGLYELRNIMDESRSRLYAKSTDDFIKKYINFYEIIMQNSQSVEWVVKPHIIEKYKDTDAYQDYVAFQQSIPLMTPY